MPLVSMMKLFTVLFTQLRGKSLENLDHEALEDMITPLLAALLGVIVVMSLV